MTNIDVIGGSGFVGERLISLLHNRKDFDVQILDKASSDMYPNLVKICDVRSLEQLREAISEDSIIVNLAAEHRDDVTPPSLYEEVNVGGARNICEIAVERNVKTIIFTSTVAVYGFAKPGTGEDGDISPFNEYGRTKHQAEQVFMEWQAEAPAERALIIIRPTVVFGEKNRGNVFNLFKQISSRRFIMVGAGANKKSLAYVENLASFILHCFKLGSGVHVYNYCDTPSFSMTELVELIMKSLGHAPKIRIRLPFIVAVTLGKMLDVYASITGSKISISEIRIRKFCAESTYSSAVPNTGFVAKVGLADAIRRTIDCEIENGEL